MSDNSLARRAEVLMSVNGVDISEDINKYIQSLTFTDEEEDKTDDLSVQIDDRDKEWVLNWLNSNITTATSSSSAASTGAFAVGDSVMIKQDAKDYNGTTLQSWVYSYKGFTVIEVGKINTDRIVIGINGVVTAAMRADDLYRGGDTATQSTRTASSNGLQGATLSVTIMQRNALSDGKDAMLECGTFQIDKIKVSGPPSKVTLSATSLPFTAAIRHMTRNRAWENIHLSMIARQIAQRANMRCMFSSDYDPLYVRKEQAGESDIVFLQRLCKAAGIALKITANTIVLFDEAEYEKKAAVRTFSSDSGDILSYDFSDGASDTTYSSCHVIYTNPTTGAVIEYTYTPLISDGSGQVLEICEKVNSREEARQLAMKRLRQKNRNKFSASIKVYGDVQMVAGCTVNIKGFGGFDGKYIIETATHSISQNGYTTQIKMHKCLEEY